MCKLYIFYFLDLNFGRTFGHQLSLYIRKIEEGLGCLLINVVRVWFWKHIYDYKP